MATDNSGAPRRLTDRQRLFCEHLNRGMSATAAAKKAGYGPAYADREAGKLVEKPQVVAYLTQLRADTRDESMADGAEIRRYLASVMRGEIEDVATGGKDLTFIHTPMPASERTKAAQELAKLDGLHAPVKLDITAKVTGQAEEWMARTLAVIADVLGEESVMKLLPHLPKLELK